MAVGGGGIDTGAAQNLVKGAGGVDRDAVRGRCQFSKPGIDALVSRHHAVE